MKALNGFLVIQRQMTLKVCLKASSATYVGTVC